MVNAGMDLAAELTKFQLEPALAEWVGKLLKKTQSDALTLQQADLKIRALTFELAYYKRIRFANKSEQFSPEQRELFKESWNTDEAALDAEVGRSRYRGEILANNPARSHNSPQPRKGFLHFSMRRMKMEHDFPQPFAQNYGRLLNLARIFHKFAR